MSQTMGNILADFMKYKPDDIDVQIQELKKDIHVRRELNKQLENKVKVDEANIICINNFIERYDTLIETQLQDITLLTDEIKNAVLFNQELKNRIEVCESVINTDRCNNVKKRLSNIKKIGKDVRDFLESRGIQSPQIDF